MSLRHNPNLERTRRRQIVRRKHDSLPGAPPGLGLLNLTVLQTIAEHGSVPEAAVNAFERAKMVADGLIRLEHTNRGRRFYLTDFGRLKLQAAQ